MALRRREAHPYMVETVQLGVHDPARQFPLEEISHIFICEGCQTLLAGDLGGISPLCYLAEQIMHRVNRGQWPIHVLAHINNCEPCAVRAPQARQESQPRRWKKTFSSGRQQAFRGNRSGKGRHHG